MHILQNTKFAFMSHVKVFLLFSLLLFAITISTVAVRGINYGIDFSGGVLLEVKLHQGVGIADVRNAVSAVPNVDASLQEFGAKDIILLRANIDNVDNTAGVGLIKQAISTQVTEFRRTEFVGPVVGEELKQNAMYAVLYSLLAIMIYIWLRFEWQYGIAALVALIHDVLITVGFIAVTGIEFGLPTVAAILTIAGYSINDTVVVFDRVRENFGLQQKKSYAEVFNLSINQSLSRTVITSVTTLIALLSLVFFGGEVIRGFAMTMAFGVIVGTYSSNCVAVPLLLWQKPNRGAKDEEVDPIKARFAETQGDSIKQKLPKKDI